MKNLKSTEPLFVSTRFGWECDLYEGEITPGNPAPIQVWGSTEEELNERVDTIKRSFEMLETLKIIRDSFWTEPSESKKHIELQNIARSRINEIEKAS